MAPTHTFVVGSTYKITDITGVDPEFIGQYKGNEFRGNYNHRYEAYVHKFSNSSHNEVTGEGTVGQTEIYDDQIGDGQRYTVTLQTGGRRHRRRHSRKRRSSRKLRTRRHR